MPIKTLIMGMLVASVLTSCNPSLKDNPLVADWNTPRETPPFNEIRLEHYKPAILYAMDINKDEIKAIVENPEAPTFENTVEALEFSGRLLNRITTIMGNLNTADTNEELQNLVAELSPILTDHSNDIALNDKLFERIKAVYENPGKLEPDQARLLEETYKSFVRSGANLNDEDKAKYRELSRKLSDLTLQFSKNALAETNAFTLNLTDEADLAGLPQSAIDAAAATAKQMNQEGWTFTLQAPSYGPFLQYSDRRDLREKMFMEYNTRAAKDNENDNRPVVSEIVNTRLQIAQLLGYETHADYVLENRMAGDKQTVLNFLNQLLDASYPFALAEVKELNEYAAKNGADYEIARWDWSYWSEKLMEEKYALNDELLRPYFKLENVIEGVLGLANRLYGLTFVENPEIQGYNPDVKCYEAFDENGEFLAVLYLDFFPRAGKKDGAWMTDYRPAEIYNGQEIRPIISLTTNFTKPTETNPSLLTYSEVNTFLHEFGHCLHGMLGRGRYPSLTGTNVLWDFVELPSQIMENWMSEAEFLNTFAKHYQTGEVIPQEYLDKIEASNKYHEGYASVRQLFFGLLDMDWYTRTEPFSGDVEAYEQPAVNKTLTLPVVPGTVTSTSFSHIFSGGYSAGYYSYKWAEVLDADAFSLFRQNGIFDKATADSFRRNILEKGDSEHPMELYKRFRGQEPTVDALLRREGFIK